MSDSLVVIIGIVLVIVGVITIYAYINITETICEKCGIRKFDKGELALHWFWEIPALVGLIYVVVGILTGEIKFGSGMNVGDVDVIELIGTVIICLLYLVFIVLLVMGVVLLEKSIYDEYLKLNPDEAKNCYKLSLLLGIITSWTVLIFVFGSLCKMFFESIGPGGIPKTAEKRDFYITKDGEYVTRINDKYVLDKEGVHETYFDPAGNEYIDRNEKWYDEHDRIT